MRILGINAVFHDPAATTPSAEVYRARLRRCLARDLRGAVTMAMGGAS